MPLDRCPPKDGLCDNEILKSSPHVMFTQNNKISLVENGKKYIVDNINNECIARVKIDDGLLASGQDKKADYAIIRCKREILYIIELKGCDISKACEQILSTIKQLKDIQVNCGFVHARIICKRVPTPALRSASYRRLEKELRSKNGSLQIHQGCKIEKYF